MFDRLKKKPAKKPFGVPDKLEVETVEVPDVDDALDKVDEALRKADEADAQEKEKEKARRERQKRYERDNGFGGGSCSC